MAISGAQSDNIISCILYVTFWMFPISFASPPIVDPSCRVVLRAASGLQSEIYRPPSDQAQGFLLVSNGLCESLKAQLCIFVEVDDRKAHSHVTRLPVIGEEAANPMYQHTLAQSQHVAAAVFMIEVTGTGNGWMGHCKAVLLTTTPVQPTPHGSQPLSRSNHDYPQYPMARGRSRGTCPRRVIPTWQDRRDTFER